MKTYYHPNVMILHNVNDIIVMSGPDFTDDYFDDGWEGK